MGTVWETWGVWPGCVTGRPSGITSHQAPTTIWSCLFQDPLAFKTQQHTQPPPPPLSSHPAPNPPVNAPRIDAVFTAIDRSYVSGHWHYSCMTSTPQTMPLLMLYMSSNIDLHSIFCSYKKRSLRKGMEKNMQGRSNTPPQTKRRREVWRIFNSVRIQTASERGGNAQLQQLKAPLAVRNLAVTRSLKTRPPLVFGWITDELFCYSDGSF